MKYLPRDILPTLGERLAHAMEQLGMSQIQLAKAAGVSQTTIHKILSGKTLESRKTGALARAMKISVAWLESGEMPATVTAIHHYKDRDDSRIGIILEPIQPWDSTTPLEDHEVEIPFYKQMELAAGSGRAVHMSDSGHRVLRFSLSTLRMLGVDPANAQCATVTGRSQEPLILHGAAIGIDRGMTKILPDQLYAIEHDGELRVKFLERLPNGGLKLISYNRTEFPDESYSFEQYIDQHMQILGRVFWWSTIRAINSPPLPKLCPECQVKT